MLMRCYRDGETVRVEARIVPAAARPETDDLKELVTSVMAPWAAPKEIVFVTELPRTGSGKVRRQGLQ
jgi:acyl-coenzyme A synthetase/AMP-(fatty) acid ligase